MGLSKEQRRAYAREMCEKEYGFDPEKNLYNMTQQLGSLPESHHHLNGEFGITVIPLYTAEQMYAYATEQVAVEQERCAILCDKEHLRDDLTSDYRYAAGVVAWLIRKKLDLHQHVDIVHPLLEEVLTFFQFLNSLEIVLETYRD